MNSLINRAVGTATLLAGGVSSAQNGGMMSGGAMWGGGWMGNYGGYWGPILMVAAVCIVVWAIMQKRK